MIYKFKVTPMGAVRQTRADAWKDRPVVLRYRRFRDELRYAARAQHFVPSDAMRLVFCMPMPTSWSKKKREAMNLKPHRQKPDVDNLTKGILDTLYGDENDCIVWHTDTYKYWTDDPIGWIEAENI